MATSPEYPFADTRRRRMDYEPEVTQPGARIEGTCPYCGPQKYVTFHTQLSPDRGMVGWVCSSCGGPEYVC